MHSMMPRASPPAQPQELTEKAAGEPPERQRLHWSGGFKIAPTRPISSGGHGFL
jgi:hypothetical protein